MSRDVKFSHTIEHLPFVFSYITIRPERFGALVYNPHLDHELSLSPVEAYIVSLFDGHHSGIQVADHARDHFGLEDAESKKSVFQTMGKLSNAYALGFYDGVAKGRLIEPPINRHTKNGPYLSAPRMVTWEITYACNLRCPHCFTESGSAKNNELDTRSALSLVDKLAEAKILRLLISGGEPFLRPDILTILRKISRTNMRLDIASNGVVLPEKILKGIRDLPVFHVHVSIDGIGKSHDRFRGHPGAFDAACKNIERLQKEGIAVSLSTTVTRQNLKELDRIIDLALDMGCSGFFANAMLPVGRGRKNAGQFQLETDGYRQLYHTLVKRGNELQAKLTISTDMCFPFLFSPPPPHSSLRGHMGCSVGQDTLCIGAEGTVYPCHFLHDFPLGNLMDNDLKPIWNKSHVLQSLRNMKKQDMSGECRHCTYAPDLCNGGCRAAAYLVHGDLKGVDPTCFKSPVADH